MEGTDGVRSPAHAGDHGVREPALGLEDLRPGLPAHDRLELADHLRIGMRARRRANQVVGVMDIGDPVPERLIHGVLQGRRARGHRLNPGTQEVHAEDVGLLALDVHGTHVDHAGQAETGADRGRGHPVLAGAGLGDDPGLAHAHGQEDLAHAVVDLVRARVVELLALEVDLRAPEFLGQALGEVHGARPADIVLEIAIQLGVEGRIGHGKPESGLQLMHQGHEGFGHVATTIIAEPARGIGVGGIVVGRSDLVHVGPNVWLGGQRRGRPRSMTRPLVRDRAPRQRKRPPSGPRKWSGPRRHSRDRDPPRETRAGADESPR